MKSDHDSLPSREQLAMIAAATQRTEPEDAVRYALSLWVAAGETLSAVSNQAADIAPAVETPVKLPTTFDEFLRVVVCAKTPADSTKRFRDYIRASRSPDAPDAEIDEIVAAYRRGDHDKPWWLSEVAVEYRNWWSRQRSIKAQASASAKKPKKSL